MSRASVEFVLRKPGVLPLPLAALQERVLVVLAGLAFRRWLAREHLPYTLAEIAPLTFPGQTLPVLGAHACHIAVTSREIPSSGGFWVHPRNVPVQALSFPLASAVDANAVHICMLLCSRAEVNLPSSCSSECWVALPPRGLRRTARNLRQPFLLVLNEHSLSIQCGAEIKPGSFLLYATELYGGKIHALPAEILRLRYLRPMRKPAGILHVGESPARIIWTIPPAGWQNIWPACTAAFFVGWIKQKTVIKECVARPSKYRSMPGNTVSISQNRLRPPEELPQFIRQG